MNGPEHYRQAEELLAGVAGLVEDTAGSIKAVMAEAQVHATLALAAATADVAPADIWAEVIR